MIKQITTENNGAFEFQISVAAGVLLGRKPGLALAWEEWGSGHDMEAHLALTPPAALAGVVVDEADKPVAGAEVSVPCANCDLSRKGGYPYPDFFPGQIARDAFATRTDGAGRFRIENLPTNAAVALAVQAPGKLLRQLHPIFSGGDPLPWSAGQEDIKLVVESVGGIEGKVVVEGSNQPPPAAWVTLRSDGPNFFQPVHRDPVQSGVDGAFHFIDVPPGPYRIQARFGTNAVPEWLADSVPVSVETGQIARGVQAMATRAGLLVVAVLGQKDGKPLANVKVQAYKDNYYTFVNSGGNGLAFLPLPCGNYDVSVSRETMSEGQTPVSMEAGKTNRVEIKIATPQKITGLVRQPDGQPAAGLQVRILGGSGLHADNVKTDAGGKFELEWTQSHSGQEETTACILVRDVEHNLAVARDVDQDTGPLDLKLAPGLTLAVRVECDGKPVTNAAATLIIWNAQLSGLSRATNASDRFEITALPPGRKYGLHVSAPGYGEETVNDVNTSVEGGRMELDPVELKLASLKLAGQVFDSDDQPLADAKVYLSGQGQPNANATSDHEGRFRFENVREGTAQLSASGLIRPNTYSSGSVLAEGGDTDVILRIDQGLTRGMTSRKLSLTSFSS